MTRYFVFIDETGTNKSDRYFGLGCLCIPVEDIGEYVYILEIQYQKIMSAIKKKEWDLTNILEGEALVNFYKGRKSGTYEMKFKHINQTTKEQYKWLISKYFTLSNCKFCCLVIDREKYPSPGHLGRFDSYVNQIAMLVRNNLSQHDECIILPDNITAPIAKQYEKTLIKKIGKRCLGVHRIESHASIFLQMVDVLIGAVLYDNKGGIKESKVEVVQKIKQKLNLTDVSHNHTATKPNYFSIRHYKKSI